MSKGAQPGHFVSDETKAKISATMTGVKQGPSPLRGRAQSPEWIAKRAAATRRYDSDVCNVDGCEKPRHAHGFCPTHATRFEKHGDPLFVTPQPTGATHHRWKGDAISYATAHKRAQKNRAATCQACKATGPRLETALLHTAPAERLRVSALGRPFSANLDDYTTLCVKCHRQYDSPIDETRIEIETLLNSILCTGAQPDDDMA